MVEDLRRYGRARRGHRSGRTVRPVRRAGGHHRLIPDYTDFSGGPKDPGPAPGDWAQGPTDGRARGHL